MIVKTINVTDDDRVRIVTPHGNECKMLIRSRYVYDGINKELGNHISVICRRKGSSKWYREDWDDFEVEKNISDFVDECAAKYHTDEAWGFYDAIETRA